MKNYTKYVACNLDEAIQSLLSIQCLFVKDPTRDFTRKRKIPLKHLVKILLSMGGNSLDKELLDYFDYNIDTASSSAFVQQREKLLPEALGFVLNEFNQTFDNHRTFNEYRLLSVDGSDVNIPMNPDDLDIFIKTLPNCKGFNLLHINALYDLLNKQYLDVIIQKNRHKNERRAVNDIVDRSGISDKTLLMLDRGYEGYNVMAHIENKNWKYLIRVREPKGKSSMLCRLNLPLDKEVDKLVKVNLSRRNTKELKKDATHRILPKAATFDYLKIGNKGRYPLEFRVVGVEIEGNKYQYFVTNLDVEEFDTKAIGELYHLRWGIETSFRELKYALGLTSFHSKKVNLIKQEIYAKMIMYNFCELITLNVIITQKPRKHTYQVNFTMAIHICKRFFIRLFDKEPPDIEALIQKYVLPVRGGRKYPRKVKFRSCISFLYRVV